MFKCEYCLTMMYTCINVIDFVLLSETIHVLIHLLCWTYFHPLLVQIRKKQGWPSGWVKGAATHDIMVLGVPKLLFLLNN